MDPFLEEPGLWPDVHHEIISTARALLNPLLGPRYVVRIEERVYVADDDDPTFPFRIPDLRIAENPSRSGDPPSAITASSATIPLTVTTMFEEEIRESRLEIVDREGRDVVTVIEVLSPSNKVPGSKSRESFMRKRSEVLHSPSHWVEIDLLRAGQVSFRIFGTPCDYRIHVSPVELRPRGHIWPVLLRDRLPTIDIPLRKQDGAISLELQQVLDNAYERGAYDRSIDYRREPVPPLSEADAAWVDELLRGNGLRP